MKSAIIASAALLGSAVAASAKPQHRPFDIVEVDLSSLQKRNIISKRDGDDDEKPLAVSPHVLQLSKVAGHSRSQTWVQSIRNGPHADGLFRTTPGSSAHVANLTYLNGFEYIATIGFGDQTLDVIIDSGSSDTWAVQRGFTCQDSNGLALNDSSTCSFGPAYNGTFQHGTIPGVHFNITYGDGEFATGPMGFQDISVAGLTVPRQQVALVNESYWEGDTVASGLLGLAFDLLTSQYPDGAVRSPDVSVPYSAIFSTMSREGIVDPDLFSMAMDSSSQTGQLAFGGLPPVETVGGFVSTPIRMIAVYESMVEAKTQYSFYTILPDGYVMKNETSYQCLPPTSNATLASSRWNTAVARPAGFLNSTTPTIVDSGTSLMYVPSDISTAFAASVPGAFYDPNSEAYYAPCNATFPDFGFVIAGRAFYANRADLLQTSNPTDFGDGKPPSCLLGVTDGGEGPYILGDTMMNSLVTVFDVGAGKMRFASRRK